MNFDETYEALERMTPTDPAITSIVEWRNSPKGDDLRAGLTMTIAGAPDRYASVQSTGQTWFQLGIDGEFHTIHLDEDASLTEAVAYLQDLVNLGVRYLHDGAEITYEGLFKRQVRVIQRDRPGPHDDQLRPATLILNADDDFKFFFRRLFGRA